MKELTLERPEDVISNDQRRLGYAISLFHPFLLPYTILLDRRALTAENPKRNNTQEGLRQWGAIWH